MSIETPADGFGQRMYKRLRRFVILRFPKRLELAGRYHYRRLFGYLGRELGILDRLVGDGGVAIDIGANIGLYSFRLSQLCRKVEYFEPNPGCVDMIKNSGLKNVTVHNVGLSSSEGTMTLYVPMQYGEMITPSGNFRGPEGAHETVEVPVKTLDSYGFTGVSFIKMDVEGHEMEVLDGAEETIRRERPVMVVEVVQFLYEFPISVIFDRIIGMGYNGFFFFDGRLHPVSEFSVDKYQVGRAVCVDNFIFVPREKTLSI